MNILYIDPMIKKSNIYSYYSGIYDELKLLTNCFLYGNDFSNITSVLQTISYNPDIIVFGMGWHTYKFFGKISGIEKLNIPIVCQIFKPQNFLKEKLDFCKINGINLILTSIPYYKDYQEITGIITKRFCYAANSAVFKDRKLNKVFDFGFTGAVHDAKHYPKGSFQIKNLRSKIHNILRKEKNISCFLKGSDSPDLKERIQNQEEYAIKINQSKMWLATEAAHGDITPRYFEVPMSRTLLFCPEVIESYRDVFKDGINCVSFKNDLSDFLDKFYYYLYNSDEINKITENAYKYFRKNHTWKNRAQELLDILKKCKRDYND